MKKTLQWYILFLILLAVFTFPMFAIAENKVEIHGYVDQGYLYSDANNYLTDTESGSFEVNEFGLNFQYFPDDKLSIGCQLGGTDMGPIGNDEVNLNWAYGDYRWRDWLGLRAGIMKSTVALHGESRNVDALHTWIVMPQSVYDDWVKDSTQGVKGVSLYGSIDMNSAGFLKYNANASNLQLSLDSGTVEFLRRFSQYQTITRAEFGPYYSGTLKWQTPVPGLLLATDYVYFENSEYEGVSLNRIKQYALGLMEYDQTYQTSKGISYNTYSLEYTIGNLVLANEWVLTKSKYNIQYTLDSADPYLGLIPTTISGTSKSTSYYVSASYRFCDWFEAGTYYSDKSVDDDRDEPQFNLEDICVTARFDVTNNMVVKFEVHSMDGLAGVDPGSDGTYDETWMLYGAKVSYNF